MRVGGQLHAPAALPPGKRPGTHCIGGWVGPRAGLDGCGKSRPYRDRPARSESLYRLRCKCSFNYRALFWWPCRGRYSNTMITYPKKLRFAVTTAIRRFKCVVIAGRPGDFVNLCFVNRFARTLQRSAVSHRTAPRLARKTAKFRGFAAQSLSLHHVTGQTYWNESKLTASRSKLDDVPCRLARQLTVLKADGSDRTITKEAAASKMCESRSWK